MSASRMPGRVASGMWADGASVKTRCSYTSSVTAIASYSWHSCATSSSSSRVNTFPVGLCGEFSSTSRVRGPNAARSSSGSNPYRRCRGRPSWWPPSCGTQRDWPADGVRERDAGRVRVVVGLEADHLVAGFAQAQDAGGDGLGGAGGDQHLAGRVVVESPEAALLIGHRGPQGALCRRPAGTGCGRTAAPRPRRRAFPADRRCRGSPARG